MSLCGRESLEKGAAKDHIVGAVAASRAVLHYPVVTMSQMCLVLHEVKHPNLRNKEVCCGLYVV